MLGIRNIFRQAADKALTAQTVLQTTDLVFNLAAGQKAHFRAWLPFTLAGTASGLKVEAVPSQTAQHIVTSYKVFNLVAAHIALDNGAVQTAPASVSGTLANAGNDLVEVEGDITGHATIPGTVGIQFAQLVSDAGAVTLLQGASIEVTYV
jgi:hypothetical protein